MKPLMGITRTSQIFRFYVNGSTQLEHTPFRSTIIIFNQLQASVSCWSRISNTHPYTMHKTKRFWISENTRNQQPANSTSNIPPLTPKTKEHGKLIRNPGTPKSLTIGVFCMIKKLSQAHLYINIRPELLLFL